MANLRVTGPLKLPKAPSQYDERDQDHTRRLIELALTAYTRQLTDTIDSIGKGASNFGFRYDPISPVHGTTTTVGTAGTPPLIQLLNPAGSGKIIVIYDCRITQEGALTAVRVRATQTPSDLNGAAAVITSAFLSRMNELDAAAIAGTLKGTTIINGTYFSAAGSNMSELTPNLGPIMNPLFGRGAGSIDRGAMANYADHQPLILQPGDALEIAGTTAGAAIALRAYAIWDELPLTAVVGVSDPNNPSAAISSCWGGIFAQVGSVNGGSHIQFYNPGPLIAKITQLDVMAHSSSYARLYRTGVPSTLGPGGAQTIGLVARMARRDQLGVQCKLNGFTFQTTYGGDRMLWRDKGHYTFGLPYEQIVGPYGAPLYVFPGDSLELQNETNGNIPISMRVFWDEVTAVAVPI